MWQHKLAHPHLVEYLRHQINIAEGKTIAVLMIELRRTVRLDAITGKVSSQSIMQHADQLLDSLLRDADRFTHFDGEKILIVLPNLANSDHSTLATVKIISELRK
ncbi:MAG: diguanylate cyclase, partial [Gallionella sp.]